jgi:hypothetical protein
MIYFRLYLLVCLGATIGMAQDEDEIYFREQQSPRPEPEADYICKRAEQIVDAAVAPAVPVIDGSIEDPIWKLAEWHALEVLGQDYKTDRVALSYDEEYLYFAGEFIDADVQVPTTEHNTDLSKDDHVGFHLRPIGSDTAYVIMASANGTTMGYSSSDNEWRPKTFEVISAGSDDGWTVEGRVGISELMPTHRKPMVRDIWRYIFYRLDVDTEQTVLSGSAPEGEWKRLKFDSEPVRAGFLKHQTMARLMMRTSFVDHKNSLARKIDRMNVSGKTTKFEFVPEEIGWKSLQCDGYALLGDSPNVFLPSMLAVHPVSASEPTIITWLNATPKRVLLFACLDTLAMTPIGNGEADGTQVSVTGKGPNFEQLDKMVITDDLWQLSLMRAPANTRVTVAVDAGPSGNTVSDKTFVAIYIVPWNPKPTVQKVTTPAQIPQLLRSQSTEDSGNNK